MIPSETATTVLNELRAQANPDNVAGMARFGISIENTLGVSIPALRKLARPHRKDHALALELWKSGIHEARILAGMVDDPALVTWEQAEAWVADFDSWDVCDQVCSNLFDQTDHVWRMVREWTGRNEEFIKRAGFTMIACLAVHRKELRDDQFQECFALIQREAGDRRNFVRKAVNWALRQIGKRNRALNAQAVQIAESIRDQNNRESRWVATDALRELTNPAVQARLG